MENGTVSGFCLRRPNSSIREGLIPNVAQGSFERLGEIAVHGAKEKTGYLCLQYPCWRNRRHRPGPPMAERPVVLPPE